MKIALQQHSFQDRDLRSLKNETWKTLPGFDGEYEISSLGRVKSLRRWRGCGYNSGYYTTEFIRKQNFRASKNKFKNDYTYTVSVALKKNGKCFTTSTARLVYYAFVSEFELGDKNKIITYKDNNGRNLNYKNLELSTRSDNSKKIIALKRSSPKWLALKIKVRQLTIEGKLVAEYPSIKMAAEAIGSSGTAISACINGKIFHHHQFRWEPASKNKNKPRVEKKDDVIFNKYLWEKIGKPKVSKSNPPPVLNLSLLTMPGEKWKIIKTANNYYISNFGRVKLKPHFKFNYHVWQKEKIIRLVPDGKSKKEPRCLTVPVSIRGQKRQLSVARLVYYHFVSPFDLENKNIKVKYKNGFFYDLNARNLYCSSAMNKMVKR